MVGYPYGKKGWKVCDIKTGEIFVSRDIIFHEETYPFVDNEKHNIESTLKQVEGWTYVDESPISGCLVEKEVLSTTHLADDRMGPREGTPPIRASAESTRPTQSSPRISEGSELMEIGRTVLGPDDNRSPADKGRA